MRYRELIGLAGVIGTGLDTEATCSRRRPGCCCGGLRAATIFRVAHGKKSPNAVRSNYPDAVREIPFCYRPRHNLPYVVVVTPDVVVVTPDVVVVAAAVVVVGQSSRIGIH